MAILQSLQNNSQMSCIFFLTPRVNEAIIIKDNNEQVQVLFEHSVHQKSMKVVGALIIPNHITKNS